MPYRGIHSLRSEHDTVDLTDDNRHELDKCKSSVKHFFTNYYLPATPELFGRQCSIYAQQESELDMMCSPDDRFVLSDWRNCAGYASIMAAFLMWKAMFTDNPVTCVIGCVDNDGGKYWFDNYIREQYKNFPKWLQVPVLRWRNDGIRLANGSRIFTRLMHAHNFRCIWADYVFLNDFGNLPPRRAEDFLIAVIPVVCSSTRSHIYFSSCGPTRKSPVAKKLWEGDNNFRKTTHYWFDEPGLTDEWRDSKLKVLGKDLFTMEHGPVERP